MRYISDDGKVFNTEQECCEHEQKIEKDRISREEKEMERQNDLDKINRKHKELQDLVFEYKRKYHVMLEGYFISFQDLVDMLYRQ